MTPLHSLAARALGTLTTVARFCRLGRAALVGCSAALAVSATPAAAALATYRWQPGIAGPTLLSQGSSVAGFQVSYGARYNGWSCSATTNVGQRRTVVMNTSAFGCNTGTYETTSQSGPFEMLLAIRDTAYSSDTIVTGQSTGTKIAFNKSVAGLAVTARVTLGYAIAGFFYPWGYTDFAINGSAVISPDLSRISGVAPAGSNLAMQVALVTNSAGNNVTLYVGDSRAAADASGTLVVDEGPSGTLTVADVVPKEATDGATVAPGSGAIVLDGFTVQTSAGTGNTPLYKLTLAFDAGTSEAVSLVEVTDVTGATVYGSVANPTLDTFDVTLAPAIIATPTRTEYRVRITPKAHGTLPRVQSWVVRAVIYNVQSPLVETITDLDSARIVVDNLPPDPPAGVAGQAGSGQVTIGWTNPLNVDLSKLVVVRGTSGTFTGTPTDGTTYTVGDALGNGTVACVITQPGTSCTDTVVVNGTSSFYQLFAVDLYGNYSAASSVVGPLVPGVTTTVSDGAPLAASVTVCPGGSATFTDAFALQASGGATDTVTGLTVRLAPGTSARVAGVALTTAGGAVVSTRTAPTAGDDWTFTGLSLAVPVAPVAGGQYRIQVTPASQAALPVVPGGSYPVTARVLAATHALATNLAIVDTADATVTIDNQSPADVGALTGTSPGSGRMTLGWTNPSTDFGGYVVVARGTSPINVAPAEGTGSYAAGTALATGVAIVCSGNLTSCADAGLVDGTIYYYEVFARDACNNWSPGAELHGGPSAAPPTLTLSAPAQPSGSIVRGGAPAAVGKITLTAGSAPVTLTAISIANVAAAPTAQPDTDVGSVVVSDDATGAVLGVASWDGTSYALSGLGYAIPASTAATLRITVSVAAGAAVGDQLQLRVTPADLAVALPAVTSGAAVTGNLFAIVAGGVAEGSTVGYSLLPQVTILNPSDAKVLSGSFRLQVHIWTPTANGTTDLLSYAYTIDGSTPDCTGTAKTLSQSALYVMGNRSAVYEATLSPAQGTYIVRACARTSDGVMQSRPVTVVVKGGGSGDGNLLVRDNSNQLCTDCHNLRTHSSQTTSRKYGSWSVSCRDCHAAHGSKNTYLVKEQITPPAVNGVQAPRTVRFRKTTGDSGVNGVSDPADASFINADTTGPCQTCHTRTSNPWDTSVARFRNTGNGDVHNTQKAGTKSCISCHKHKNGFSPESRGGDTCDQCHPKIWERMNGATAKVSRHPIGNVPGVNAAATDSNITWASPPGSALKTENDPAVRSCLNMCHPDKRHNQPGGWTHSFGVYGDATTGASRAVTRGSDGEIVTGNVSDTDFDSSQPSGGLCTSCHQNPVNSGGYTISKGTFAGTAHDFDSDATWGTWGYTQRDGSRFRRNCTKCHSDRADRQPSDDSYPFGAVHYSDYPKLLAGSLMPGADGQSVFLCYNCHGNGVIGVNRSNDLASSTNKFYAHPINADQTHQLGDTEYNNAAWGNMLGNPGGRHASCLDCHVTHTAKRGGHAYISGTVSVAASGTVVTGTGTRWTPFYNGARIKFGSSLLGGTTWYTIATVNSPTSLTLTAAGPSTAQTNVAYRIEQMSNVAAPAIDGAWGVVPNLANIAAGAKGGAADFTKKKLAYNQDLEAYLCLKCHTTFWWGSATPPVSASGFSYYVGTATFTQSGTIVTGQGTTWTTTSNPNRYVGALIKSSANGTYYRIASIQSATQLTLATPYAGATVTAGPYSIQMTHTDQLQEFNTKNAGYHPVLASRTTQPGYGTGTIGNPSVPGNYWPVTQNILAPWTMTSVMTCSDCHEADSPNDAGGPHGSSYKFMLKGPNRIWDENTKNSSSGMPPGTFCANCHDPTFTNSRFPEHRIGDHAGNIMCFDCHNAIPHGSSSIGMLNNGNGSGFSDHVYPYDQSVSGKRLYIRQIPSGGYFNNQNYCGCSNPTTHG